MATPDFVSSLMAHNPARLKVLERAFSLSVDIHRMVDRYAPAMMRVSPGMRAQLLRACDSIALNITEAAGHESPARVASQLTTAIGSCNEVELQLRLAVALEAVPLTYTMLIEEAVEVRRMIFGLRKHILSGPAPHSVQ